MQMFTCSFLDCGRMVGIEVGRSVWGVGFSGVSKYTLKGG